MSNMSQAVAEVSRRPKWIAKWDEFWFKPQSPIPMAIFRILFGCVLLENQLVHLLPDFDLYYSKNSIIPIKDMISLYWHNDHMFDVLLLLPNDDRWLLGAFYVLIGFTVMLTLGVFTRLSSWIVFMLLMSFGHQFELNQNAGDNYMRIAAMCLAFSNAGDAFSVDALLRNIKKDWRITGFYPLYSAPWAQRLLQIQLLIAYCHTFFGKIEGTRWNDGTAVYYAVRYDDIIRFPIPHFIDKLWFYQVSTYGTLLVEFVLWNLIWWKPARYWVLLAGLALHLGIEYFMNLPMFEWNFMFTYLLFIDPQDMVKVANKAKAYITLKFGAPLIVAFDNNCLSCVKYVGLLHRLDIFGRLTFADVSEPSIKELLPAGTNAANQVLIQSTDGKWLSGFEGWRQAAIRLPLTWLPALLAHIPVLDMLVKAFYLAFAANSQIWFGQDSLAPSKPIMSEGAA